MNVCSDSGARSLVLNLLCRIVFLHDTGTSPGSREVRKDFEVRSTPHYTSLSLGSVDGGDTAIDRYTLERQSQICEHHWRGISLKAMLLAMCLEK